MIKSPSLRTYIGREWTIYIEPHVWQQLILIAVVVLLSSVIGVGVGVLVYRSPALSSIAVAATATLFQLPSLALAALLLPIFGLGWTTAIVLLLIYAPLPVMRNTIVGLQGLDAGVIESAKGIGMSRTRMLLTIQLPLAWPVILAGLRVATMTISGISAIAAYLAPIGLGVLIYDGLSRAGAVNATNQALVGTGGVAIIALLFDAGYVGLRRLTVSRGIRG